MNQLVQNPPCGVMLVKREALLAPILLLSCREVFREKRIRHETSGRGALAALREEPAELLVCGLNLPDMDGLDFLRLDQGKSALL